MPQRDGWAWKWGEGEEHPVSPSRAPRSPGLTAPSPDRLLLVPRPRAAAGAPGHNLGPIPEDGLGRRPGRWLPDSPLPPRAFGRKVPKGPLPPPLRSWAVVRFIESRGHQAPPLCRGGRGGEEGGGEGLYQLLPQIFPGQRVSAAQIRSGASAGAWRAWELGPPLPASSSEVLADCSWRPAAEGWPMEYAAAEGGDPDSASFCAALPASGRAR